MLHLHYLELVQFIVIVVVETSVTDRLVTGEGTRQ